MELNSPQVEVRYVEKEVPQVREVVREVVPQDDSFSFWKFMGGFFPISGKKTGKLIYYIILISLGLFLYNKFIVGPAFNNEYSSQVEGAENVTFNQQTVVEDDRALFFGLQIAKVKFGLTYERAKLPINKGTTTK